MTRITYNHDTKEPVVTILYRGNCGNTVTIATTETLATLVEFSWNVMAHGDAWEGKWRGNWQMQWVASTFHTTSEHGVSSITTADAAHLGCQQSTELTPPPGRFKWTGPFRAKDEIRFLLLCHHISTGLYTKSSFKYALDCSACGPSSANLARDIWVGHSPLGLTFEALNESVTKYLNLKWIHEWNFK